MGGLSRTGQRLATLPILRFQGARPSCREFVYVATVIAPENATEGRPSTVPQMQRLRNHEYSWYRLRSPEKIRGIDYARGDKFVVSTTRQGKVRGIGYAPADGSWPPTRSAVLTRWAGWNASPLRLSRSNPISSRKQLSIASSAPGQSEPRE